jgi:sorbitol-specific phosphotransferase system component IIBC
MGGMMSKRKLWRELRDMVAGRRYKYFKSELVECYKKCKECQKVNMNDINGKTCQRCQIYRRSDMLINRVLPTENFLDVVHYIIKEFDVKI